MTATVKKKSKLTKRKLNRKYIYTVTTLGKLVDTPGWPASEGVANFARFRTWGWFSTLESAVKNLHKYPTWYHEAGYYTYVVIEQVGEGISFVHEETWFVLNKDKWSACLKPKAVAKIVGWGLG